MARGHSPHAWLDLYRRPAPLRNTLARIAGIAQLVGADRGLKYGVLAVLIDQELGAAEDVEVGGHRAEDLSRFLSDEQHGAGGKRLPSRCRKKEGHPKVPLCRTNLLSDRPRCHALIYVAFDKSVRSFAGGFSINISKVAFGVLRA